jgi:hypothetical protein
MNPSVPFTFIQSKEDEVQYEYYLAIAATDHVKIALTPAQFYSNCTKILSGYNSVYKNFLVYLIDGTHHMFLCEDVLYTADPKGPSNNGITFIVITVNIIV